MVILKRRDFLPKFCQILQIATCLVGATRKKKILTAACLSRPKLLLRSRPKLSSDQTFQTKIISDQTLQREINADQTFQTQVTPDQTSQTQGSLIRRSDQTMVQAQIQTITQTLIRL